MSPVGEGLWDSTGKLQRVEKGPLTQIKERLEAMASPLVAVFGSRMPTSACVKGPVPALCCNWKVAEPLRASA